MTHEDRELLRRCSGWVAVVCGVFVIPFAFILDVLFSDTVALIGAAIMSLPGFSLSLVALYCPWRQMSRTAVVGFAINGMILWAVLNTLFVDVMERRF